MKSAISSPVRDVDVHDEAPRLVRHAVVLHRVVERVVAARDDRQLPPHPRLRAPDQLLGRSEHALDPAHREQVLDPPPPQRERAEHRVEIAPGQLRGAVIREHDLPDVHHVVPRLHQPHGREAEALLVDLTGVAGERTRSQAADLGDVPDRRGEPEQLALVEDALEQHVLREVAPAAVGVVVDPDVARAERVGAELLEHPADAEVRGAEHRRVVLGLRDHPAGAVEERADEVEALVEDRGVRRLHHGDPHLAADAPQPVVEQRELDGDPSSGES